MFLAAFCTRANIIWSIKWRVFLSEYKSKNFMCLDIKGVLLQNTSVHLGGQSNYQWPAVPFRGNAITQKSRNARHSPFLWKSSQLFFSDWWCGVHPLCLERFGDESRVIGIWQQHQRRIIHSVTRYLSMMIWPDVYLNLTSPDMELLSQSLFVVSWRTLKYYFFLPLLLLNKNNRY